MGLKTVFDIATGNFWLQKKGITAERRNISVAALLSGLLTVMAFCVVFGRANAPGNVKNFSIVLGTAALVALLPLQGEAAWRVGRQAAQKRSENKAKPKSEKQQRMMKAFH